jgi:hypothetical protein
MRDSPFYRRDGVLADRFPRSIDEIGSSVGVAAFSPIDF